MWKLLCVLGALALPTAAAAQNQSPPAASPAAVEVMILGTYHMDNPGRDLHNSRIDPVTTPEKQAELEAVAEGLARFRPTAIALEIVATDRQTLLDQNYPAFTPADLATQPNERVQIGYRLAHRLGVTRVYGIDEKDRPGQPSYFPFGDIMAWAGANNRMAQMGAMQQVVAAEVASIEQRQKTETVGQMLAWFNRSEQILASQGVYAGFMAFGAGDDQPGAVLNGRWYTRNAIIFAHLMQTARPGDRIVVLYGAGHAYWLRQMVQTTPGFRLVEATDYLPVD